MSTKNPRADNLIVFLNSFGADPENFKKDINKLVEGEDCEENVMDFANTFSEGFLNQMLNLLKERLIITPKEIETLKKQIAEAQGKTLDTKKPTKPQGKTLLHHKYMKKYGDHSIRDYVDNEFDSGDDESSN